MKGYPKWFSPRFIHVCTVALVVSGAFLAPTTLFTRFELDIAWKLNSDAHPWVIAIHTLFGLISIAILGALWSIHMRYWWRKHKARLSGGFLLAFFLSLVLSGFGLLYAGDETAVLGLSSCHLGLGFLFAGPYVFHTVFQKK